MSFNREVFVDFIAQQIKILSFLAYITKLYQVCTQYLPPLLISIQSFLRTASLCLSTAISPMAIRTRRKWSTRSRRKWSRACLVFSKTVHRKLRTCAKNFSLPHVTSWRLICENVKSPPIKIFSYIAYVACLSCRFCARYRSTFQRISLDWNWVDHI